MPRSFAELMQYMPVAWAVLMGLSLVAGLVLWAFGGRLARKGVMLSGFVLGGLASMALAAGITTEGQGLWVIGLGMVGAIAGVLLAWLLFRLWMGLTAGLLLAATVPVAAMIWQGITPPLTSVAEVQTATLDAMGAGESDPAATQLRDPAKLDEFFPMSRPGVDPAPAAQVAGESETAAGQAVFLEALGAIWQRQVEAVRGWWGALEPGQRGALISGSAIGGALGLVLGLIMPLLAASLQSAVVGSILIFFAGRALLLAYVPASAAALPTTWRGVLVSLGLITLLGVLIQWTVRRRTTDD